MIKVKITLRNGNHYELTSESTREDMREHIGANNHLMITIKGVDKTISVVSEEILAIEIDDDLSVMERALKNLNPNDKKSGLIEIIKSGYDVSIHGGKTIIVSHNGFGVHADVGDLSVAGLLDAQFMSAKIALDKEIAEELENDREE